MVCYKIAEIRIIDKKDVFLIIADNMGMIKKIIMELEADDVYRIKIESLFG